MQKVLVIAEAGVNHNGSIETAKQLARTAKECGADIVKFQTAKLDSLVSKYAGMAQYQKENIGKEASQKEMLKKLLLPYPEFEILADYCREIGIQFLSTPFDLERISFLEHLGLDMWKIPSGEVTNLPYLIKIARTGKPVILSTGMCRMSEVEKAVEILREYGTTNLSVLHCTTEYPAPYEDANLSAIKALQERLHVPVGYSDHTAGTEASIAAVALGAVIIEKHFTISRQMEGPDHKASLEPEELKKLISGIRNIEMALGNGNKIPSKSERKNINVARKSIVAKQKIKKGEILTEENITTKRPGNGISPMRWFEILGTPAVRDFEEDELLEV